MSGHRSKSISVLGSAGRWLPVVLLASLLVVDANRLHAQKTEPATTVRIHGRVLDSKGQPVAKQKVRAIGSFRFRKTVTTDDAGRFELRVPPKIARYLSLQTQLGSSIGYQRLSYGDYPAGTSRKVNLKLQPARRVPVIVRDEVKRPIAGAWVAAIGYYRLVAEAKTNADGKALLLAPANAPLMNVFARKRRVGLDYVCFRPPKAPASNPALLPQNFAKTIALTLNGTVRVRVRVVDGAGKAMPGISVYPWYFQKPKRGRNLNISGIDRFFQKSDDTGEVLFDTVPIDNTGNLVLHAYAPNYHAPKRSQVTVRPGTETLETTITLLPLVELTGTVVTPKGRPGKNVPVIVSGNGYGLGGFRNTTRTDDRGRFRIRVNPDMYYQLVAANEDFASEGFNLVVRRKTPKDKIELVLRDAVRVHGRLTVGEDRKPMAGQYVQLYQRDAQDYHKLPENERLHNPDGSRQAISAYISRNTRTDKDGRYEFFVGKGTYYIIGPAGVKPPRFEITKQKSHEVNLHSDGPPTLKISGRVIAKGKPAGAVAGVEINGVALKSRMRYLKAVTDKAGRFAAVRGRSDMVVHARSRDGKLAGMTNIKANDKTISIALRPTGSATGLLVDKTTGKPIAEATIDYGRLIKYTGGTFSLWFGGRTKSDAEGRFTLSGIVPGIEYELWVASTRGDKIRGWSKAHKFTLKKPGRNKLGKVQATEPE